MKTTARRTWVLYAAATFIVAFTCFFYLRTTTAPIALPEGVRAFAAPSTVVFGLLAAAGLRLLGVTAGMSHPLEAAAPLLLFFTASLFSRTPLISGFYKESGWALTSIFAGLYAGTLLIGCVEGLYQNRQKPFQWKNALLLLLAMCACVAAQLANDAVWDAFMQGEHPAERDIAFVLIQYVLPLAVALGVGCLTGAALRAGDPVGARFCLCIGCAGLVAWAVARVFPNLWNALPPPLSWPLDNTQAGTANTDALTVYCMIASCGIFYFVRAKRAHG